MLLSSKFSCTTKIDLVYRMWEVFLQSPGQNEFRKSKRSRIRVIIDRLFVYAETKSWEERSITQKRKQETVKFGTDSKIIHTKTSHVS